MLTKHGLFTHTPWDHAALTGVLGPILKQRTIKTVCGKTVKFSLAVLDETVPTCADCQRVNAERDAFLASLPELADKAIR